MAYSTHGYYNIPARRQLLRQIQRHKSDKPISHGWLSIVVRQPCATDTSAHRLRIRMWRGQFQTCGLRAWGFSSRGSDVSAKVVEQARENARKAAVPADFNVANIYEMSSEAAAAELIVCCEVLEHLEETGKALDLLVRSAHPWLLVSVPREPIWRALNVVRGAYWRDLGNTPGHVQHWSTSAFVDVLRSRVDVIQVRKPLPWTMVLCRVDGSK